MVSMTSRLLLTAAAVVFAAGVPAARGPLAGQTPRAAVATMGADRALVDRYCVGCHNTRLKTGGLALDSLDLQAVGPHAETWEKVLRKLRSGQMPPAGVPRPDRAATAAFTSALASSLDRAAQGAPNPGRPTIHRLNRTEYVNSVRDLLALEVDGRALLPADDTDAHGFDNHADVLTISPALTARDLSAARKISRLALGRSGAPAVET